jgi:hypothetical protein
LAPEFYSCAHSRHIGAQTADQRLPGAAQYRRRGGDGLVECGRFAADQRRIQSGGTLAGVARPAQVTGASGRGHRAGRRGFGGDVVAQQAAKGTGAGGGRPDS